MAMLNKTEVRKVRRYAALPKLGIAAMLVSILFIFWWLVLEMLDDLVFHDDAGVYRIGLFFSIRSQIDDRIDPDFSQLFCISAAHFI